MSDAERLAIAALDLRAAELDAKAMEDLRRMNEAANWERRALEAERRVVQMQAELVRLAGELDEARAEIDKVLADAIYQREEKEKAEAEVARLGAAVTLPAQREGCCAHPEVDHETVEYRGSKPRACMHTNAKGHRNCDCKEFWREEGRRPLRVEDLLDGLPRLSTEAEAKAAMGDGQPLVRMREIRRDEP